jgi:ATP-dependent DNA helicase RecG
LNTFLETPIEFLKSVGPLKADLLKTELAVFRFGDLLRMYPFRYVDRTIISKISDASPDSHFVQFKGRFTSLKTIGDKKGKRLSALFSDGSGVLEVVWFQGMKWVEKLIEFNQTYVLYGRVSLFGNKLNMAHPEMETFESYATSKHQTLQPIYSSTEKLKNRGLDTKGLMKLTEALVKDSFFQIEEIFPDATLKSIGLMPRQEAYVQIHFPKNLTLAEAAIKRVKFEELFFMQLKILLLKKRRNNYARGIIFSTVGEYFNEFYTKHLPFTLTNAQKRVVKEIRHDMKNGKQMNRLLQGDVGSGKTMVAFLSMLIALDNGFQTCLMAPTEILAQQHFESLAGYCKDLNIEIGLLTGSTNNASRTILLEALSKGNLKILVGTHALIEEKVVFANLGLVVIDEQHRFGVEQRAKLWKKGESLPHILVMTATPIPRTLAMTVYGDLDVSVIDELPANRKPILTKHIFENSRLRLIGLIKEQIDQGRQAYAVYPLIEESEKMDYQNLVSGFDFIKDAFPFPNYNVCMVHGRMRPDEKEKAMIAFSQGKAQIMVATSVIEVGVNVPNATLMIIESAEKFGLAQLHQLRGRVGRGAEQSYCVLVTGVKLSKEARQRMDAMVQTTDGFKIADLDLTLRGPGEIDGLRQSGAAGLKLTDLSKDGELLRLARFLCENILDADPDLNNPQWNALKSVYKKLYQATDWSRIS